MLVIFPKNYTNIQKKYRLRTNRHIIFRENALKYFIICVETQCLHLTGADLQSVPNITKEHGLQIRASMFKSNFKIQVINFHKISFQFLIALLFSNSLFLFFENRLNKCRAYLFRS